MNKFAWSVVLSLTALLAAPVQALVVSPGRTEVRVAPGASTGILLSVTNDGQEDVNVEASTKDWFIPEEYKDWTVDRWLTLHGDRAFTLRPGQTRTVSLTVTCPAEMKGEVVAMTSFAYRTHAPSMVTPMISVSVYLMAAGYEKVEGHVEDLLARVWENTLSVTARVRSTGNVHLRPSGSLRVLNARGEEVAKMMVPEGQPTYPGKEALYTGQTPLGPALSKGKYVLEAVLTYQGLKLQKTRAFKILRDGKVEMGKMN